MKLTVKLPNFTMTRGKVPGKGGGGGALRNLRRNFRRYLLWGLLGLVSFVFFAWLSLPTRAIAWRISHEAKAQGYVIDIEDVSISPFGGVTLENVQWTFAPSRPGQIPTKFILDEVDVDISILSLLVGNLDVELEAVLDEGSVTGRYYRGGDESQIELEVADLPLYGVPKAAQALNAPLRGLLVIKVDLTMPEHKFADATGVIELTCAACTVGDGEEKLYVPGSKSLSSGVVIPEIDMGTLSGRMTVEEGVATTDGPIETKSDDVWIEISGSMTFKDPFGKSRFAMVLKFNLSEQLQDKSEPMRFMIQTANPKTKLDAPEKGLGFKLEGPVAKPRFIGIKSKSRRQSRLDKRAQQRARDERRRKKRRPTTRETKKDDKKDDKVKDDKDDKDDKKDDAAGRDPSAADGPKVGEPIDVRPIEPSDDDRYEPREPREPREPGSEEPSGTEEPRGEERPGTEEPAAEGQDDGNDAEQTAEGNDAEQPAEGNDAEQPAQDGGEQAEGGGEGDGR
ncbi:MAG: type II secretion system protein GspN [Myxococcota bacterium]